MTRIRATARMIDRWANDEGASADDHADNSTDGIPRYDDGTLHVAHILDRHLRGPNIYVLDEDEARHLAQSADYWADFYNSSDGADAFEGPMAAASAGRYAAALRRVATQLSPREAN